MTKFNMQMVQDVDKLFEEKTVGEILEIERLLDMEIEHKRGDLRSMVG